jgi:biopolymer transport protein ExbB/TolQ
MTRKSDFVFQLVALVVAVIAVHATYEMVIRPRAVAHLEKVDADPQAAQKRSLSVIMKDYEQESCVILALWAMAILASKARVVSADRRSLSTEVLQLPEGRRVLPEDARDLSRGIEGLPAETQEALLPRALMVALHRFDSSRNIQDVAEAANSVCQAEAERLESELAIIRYIAWAIPSLGFIGTVRGISEALGKAHSALTGDITGVTQSLGVAFNSTLVALLISIVLMFLIHQLQLFQERYVLDTQAACEERLIRHLHTR